MLPTDYENLWRNGQFAPPTPPSGRRAFDGTGSARDWAAKVTRLLGVRAVVARSFERIHRTNLVALGVLPLQCPDLDPDNLTGTEEFDITGLNGALSVNDEVIITVRLGCIILRRHTGHTRIDTAVELEWIRAGALLAHSSSRPADRAQTRKPAVRAACRSWPVNLDRRSARAPHQGPNCRG